MGELRVDDLEMNVGDSDSQQEDEIIYKEALIDLETEEEMNGMEEPGGLKSFDCVHRQC